MKWLLWREYRLNRLILTVAAFLMLVPYLVVLITFCVTKVNLPSHVPPWAAAIGGAAYYSVILNQLTLALLGGNAFAGERRDGSAEFMAYQPVSRGQRVASKLLLVLITCGIIWSANALVMALVWPYLNHGLTDEAIWGCLFVLLTGLAFFGVAWLVSSFQSSATFAVAAGLIAPFLLVAVLQFVAWWLNWEVIDQRAVATGYAIGCGVLALISFPIGTAYYLRRIEP